MPSIAIVQLLHVATWIEAERGREMRDEAETAQRGGETAKRDPAESVIAGLTTTADKIRALGQAGYLRTEISKLLDIRYQQVRAVLLRAGITDGLQRAAEVERARIPVKVLPEVRNAASWEALLRAGFRYLGDWTSRGDTEFDLDAKAPSEPGVYAFIIDEVVMYVGLTQTGLRSRLDAYRRGYVQQRTNARVKGLIQTALAANKRVKVLIATPAPGEWNGLPINTAAGLEAGLIRMMRPEWNMLGAG